MSTEELTAYLSTYIKACKVKGCPYILVYMGVLYILDEELSTIYIVTLDHPISNVATKLDLLNQGTVLDVSIFNLINKVLDIYRTLSVNEFRKLSRSEVDYEIPAHATDDGKLTRYYFDDSPTDMILIPEFYGMVPVNKSDTYEVYHKYLNGINSILMYKVYKKKPKMEIVMYRRILNLY